MENLETRNFMKVKSPTKAIIYASLMVLFRKRKCYQTQSAECRDQRVQEKSETTEKRLESGLKYYSTDLEF